MVKCELLNCVSQYLERPFLFFWTSSERCAGLAVFMMASSERFLPLASEMAGRERDQGTRVHFPRPRGGSVQGRLNTPVPTKGFSPHPPS